MPAARTERALNASKGTNAPNAHAHDERECAEDDGDIIPTIGCKAEALKKTFYHCPSLCCRQLFAVGSFRSVAPLWYGVQLMNES